MIDENKFNKICKYKTRLGNAYKNNKKEDCLKYFNHLKYHVGGLNQNSYINELFERILEIIKKPEYNLLEQIKEKKHENNELKINNDNLRNNYDIMIQNNNILFDENNKFKKNNNELTNKNVELTNTLDELFKNIEKYLADYLKLQSTKNFNNNLELVKSCNDVINLLMKSLEHNRHHEIKYKEVKDKMYGNIKIMINIKTILSLSVIDYSVLLRKILCYYYYITSKLDNNICEDKDIIKYSDEEIKKILKTIK